MIAHGVREYAEEYDVKVETDPETRRWVVTAMNEGGYNSTSVDIIDLINWLKANKPELLV